MPSSPLHQPTHQLLPEGLFLRPPRTASSFQKIHGLIPGPPCHPVTFLLGGKHSYSLQQPRKVRSVVRRSWGEDGGWKSTPKPVWGLWVQEVLRVGCRAAGFEKRLAPRTTGWCPLTACLSVGLTKYPDVCQTLTGTFRPTVQQNRGESRMCAALQRSHKHVAMGRRHLCRLPRECPGRAPAPWS